MPISPAPATSIPPSQAPGDLQLFLEGQRPLPQGGQQGQRHVNQFDGFHRVTPYMDWGLRWKSRDRGREKTPRKLKRRGLRLRDDSNVFKPRYHPGCRVRGHSSALQQALSHGNGASGTPYLQFSGVLLWHETAHLRAHRLTATAGSLEWSARGIMPSSHLQFSLVKFKPSGGSCQVVWREFAKDLQNQAVKVLDTLV